MRALFALLFALLAALIPSLVGATSPASCPATSNGYQEEKLFFLYRSFCNKLSTTSFASYESFTGSATDPWVSFGFENIGGACTEDICNQDLSTLTTSCQLSNHTIFGGGTIGNGMWNYNFTIYSASFQPGQDGTPPPTTTLSASLDGAVQSSIESVLASSFSLTLTKNAAAATTTTTSSSSSSSSSTISSTSTTSALSSSVAGPLSTGISVSNVTVTSAGPYGNSTRVIASTATVSMVVWTTGTAGAGGSTITGAAAAARTSSSSAATLRVVGLRLVGVGFVALFL